MSWSQATLAEATLRVAKIDPATLKRETFRYIDIGSVDGELHTVEDTARISVDKAPGRARQLVRYGDTVFSTVRPYLEKIGFIGTDLDGEIASTGFCVLRPAPGVDPRFLFHFATSRALLDQVLPLQRGVSYPAVRDSDVLAAKISLPSSEEQLRIVDILEGNLSRLDAANSSIARAESQLTTLSESALQAALASVNAEKVPLGRVLAVPLSNGRSVPTSEYGFPVLRLTALRNGRIDLNERKVGDWSRVEALPFLVAAGDFLVARGNGSLSLVGRGGLVDNPVDEVAFPDTMIRVRPDPSVVSASFLALVWNSRDTRRQIEAMARTTAGIYKVNQKQLAGVQLRLPSLLDQETVVRRLRALQDGVTRLAGETIKTRNRAESLRRALLAAAFSGKLTGGASDSDRIEELTATT